MEPHTQVEVDVLPKCDFCKGAMASDAKYDGKTVHGSWAYMCDAHWALNSTGRLGLGWGQRLILRSDDAKK